MEKSIFATRSGWLSYAPFRHYQLPRLVHVTEREVVGKSSRPGEEVNVVYGDEKRVTVPFVNQAGNVMFTRPLYRLEWPGEMSACEVTEGGDDLPSSIIKNLPGHEFVGTLPPASYSLWDMVHDRRLHLDDCRQAGLSDPPPMPRELPPIIAYHLAVNRKLYFEDNPAVHHPVAALSSARVEQVLDARFAVDSNYSAALAYLKWTAESHHRHPLLQGFDTNVRETLMGLSHTAAELYFYLLADCMYDTQRHYWSREGKYVWLRLALYLHYVGRVGGGLYAHLAGIDPPSGIREDVVAEHMGDVLDRVLEWRDTLGEQARRMSHVSYEETFLSGDTVGEVIDR